LSRLRRSAIGCRGFLRTGETCRRDLSWRPIGRAIVAPSRQVSSVRQEDHRSHQADGTHRLEANPFLSRRLLSDLSDNRRGRGSLDVSGAWRLHQRAAAATPWFPGAAYRGIHRARWTLLIGTVAGRRALLCLRICRDDRLTALPRESACNFVSSYSQIRPLSRKLFGNCAKTSIQVSVAFCQASNKGCRFGVDPAPVDACLEATCAGP